jgi:hypothetical protein
MQIKLLILSSSILASSLVYAIDGGEMPGYIYTPAANNAVIKTGYGKCIHNGYWQPEYGKSQCGEAQSESQPLAD